MASGNYVTPKTLPPTAPGKGGANNSRLSTGAPNLPRNVAGQNRKGTGSKGAFGRG